MLENVNPMLIIAIIGVVIVIALIVYLDPFGFRDRFTNVKERFDGITALNKKIFEQISPMATPNVADPNKSVPNIPSNSAKQLNSLIFPEINQLNAPVAQVVEQPIIQPTEEQIIQQTEQPVVTPFILPEMVVSTVDTEQVILPSPIMPELVAELVAEPETEPVETGPVETKPFELPPTISTEPVQPEGVIEAPLAMKEFETPPAMKELEIPPTTQSTFELPKIINTDETQIVPQNETSVITSLEDQNKPVNVQSIVSEIPSENTPQNAADLIKQQIEQPVIQQAVPLVTTSSIVNINNDNSVAGGEVVGGLVNQFTNSRILGAFPLYK